MANIRRMHSEATLARMPSVTNLNVNWMSEKQWWPAYIVLIVLYRLLVLFCAPFISQEWQWTSMTLLHCAVSTQGRHDVW